MAAWWWGSCPPMQSRTSKILVPVQVWELPGKKQLFPMSFSFQTMIFHLQLWHFVLLPGGVNLLRYQLFSCPPSGLGCLFCFFLVRLNRDYWLILNDWNVYFLSTFFSNSLREKVVFLSPFKWRGGKRKKKEWKCKASRCFFVPFSSIWMGEEKSLLFYHVLKLRLSYAGAFESAVGEV